MAINVWRSNCQCSVLDLGNGIAPTQLNWAALSKRWEKSLALVKQQTVNTQQQWVAHVLLPLTVGKPPPTASQNEKATQARATAQGLDPVTLKGTPFLWDTPLGKVHNWNLKVPPNPTHRDFRPPLVCLHDGAYAYASDSPQTRWMIPPPSPLEQPLCTNIPGRLTTAVYIRCWDCLFYGRLRWWIKGTSKGTELGLVTRKRHWQLVNKGGEAMAAKTWTTKWTVIGKD
jgi:hypothetical protein